VATRQAARQEPAAPASLLIDFETPMISSTSQPSLQPQPQSQLPPQLQPQPLSNSKDNSSLFVDDPLFSDFNSSFTTPQPQQQQTQRPQPIALSGAIPQNITIPSPATNQPQQPAYPVTGGYGSASNLAMVRPTSSFTQSPMVAAYVASPAGFN